MKSELWIALSGIGLLLTDVFFVLKSSNFSIRGPIEVYIDYCHLLVHYLGTSSLLLNSFSITMNWIEIHSPEIHEILDFSCSFAIDHSSSHMVRISREKWCLLFCSLSFLPNQVNYDFYIYIITYLFLVQWYIL